MRYKMTNNDRVLTALSDGKNKTVAQLEKATRVSNVTATIAELRKQGYCIYTNKVRGESAYRLGTPSKAMIALVQQVFPALFQR